MIDNKDNQALPEVTASDVKSSAHSDQSAVSKTSGRTPEDTVIAPALEVAAGLQAAALSDQSADSDLLDELRVIQNGLVANTLKPGVPPEPSTADPTIKSQDGVQPKQAAQLSDKVETVAALVEGQSPKPPGTQSKRKTNKVSFRGDDDLLYAISEYAIAAGVDESEAARRLIATGLGKTHIVITPKSPPELLEFFAGALKTWSRDFATIKSRLNAPMPTTADKELVTLVTNWRSIAAQLQSHVPTLIQSAQSLADLLTSLNAKKIESLRDRYSLLLKWIASRKASLAKGGLSENEVATQKSILEQYDIIKSLIEDLGIIKPEDIK